MANLEIPNSIKLTNPKPVDGYYGNYTSVSAAKAGVPAAVRYKGLTVGVVSGGEVKEYWWKSGTTDADLVEKTSGASSNGQKNLTSDYTLTNDDNGKTIFTNSKVFFDVTTQNYDDNFKVVIKKTDETAVILQLSNDPSMTWDFYLYDKGGITHYNGLSLSSDKHSVYILERKLGTKKLYVTALTRGLSDFYNDAGFITKVNDDTTPKLAADLDANSKKITNLGLPTNQKDAATKKYVDDLNRVQLVGTFDASTATDFPTITKKGSAYKVTTDGEVHNTWLYDGDLLIAAKDNPSTTLPADWLIQAKSRELYKAVTFDSVLTAYSSVADLLLQDYDAAHGYLQGSRIICAYASTPTEYIKISDVDTDWVYSDGTNFLTILPQN